MPAAKNAPAADAVTEAPASTRSIPARPSDWDHPNQGWTVQTGTKYENTDPIPGQVFIPKQLPDAAVQAASGIDASAHRAGLVVISEEEAANHPGGPEPHDHALLPGGGTSVYAGTLNAATVTDPKAEQSPAIASTVDASA